MHFEQQIITAFIGLLVGTLLGNEISRFLYRPRVIIKFKKMNPLITKDGFFWSIIVANFGRTVASNCIGTISIDDLAEKDLMEPHEAVSDESLPSYKEEKIDLDFPRSQLLSPTNFRPVRNVTICWSMLGNPFKIDINPGMTQGLDVFRVQYHKENKFWYLIIPSEKGWRKVRLRMKLKTFTGKLFVCPSNEFPTILDFEIDISQDQQPIFIAKKIGRLKRLTRFINRRKIYFD